MPSGHSATARAVLAQVDPGRLHGRRPVGLRDGAVLALLAGGLTVRDIACLRADAITLDGGRIHIALDRGDALRAVLTGDLAARLLAWLAENRLWGTAGPVFTGPHGPLTVHGVYHVLKRYRARRRR